MDFSLTSWMAPRLSGFEAALSGVVDGFSPDRFREACAYPLATGGKRMRPLLCFAAAEAVGGPWQAAMPAALAVEMVHTFSLVHDDLPCMDNDDLRRGRPTVHRQYDEPTALLVGDALLAEALLLLARAPGLSACVADLAEATRIMCEGQFLDMQRAEGPGDVEALTALHRAKTGALIRAAVRMGGRSAGASEADLLALDRCSDNIGLAFQVHDDVLDAHEALTPGGAPNFIRLLGLDGTRALAQQLADNAVNAVAHLPAATALTALARYTVERAH